MDENRNLTNVADEELSQVAGGSALSAAPELSEMLSNINKAKEIYDRTCTNIPASIRGKLGELLDKALELCLAGGDDAASSVRSVCAEIGRLYHTSMSTYVRNVFIPYISANLK